MTACIFVKNRQNLDSAFLYFENAYSAGQLKIFGVSSACVSRGMHPGPGTNLCSVIVK